MAFCEFLTRYTPRCVAGLAVLTLCAAVSAQILPAQKSPASPVTSLGPTYPVIEPDILQLLKTHAAENREKTQQKLRDSQDRLQAYAREPSGTALPAAKETQTVKIPVSAEALRIVGDDFERRWLMINANRPEEVKLAHALLTEDASFRKNEAAGLNALRVILVDGSVAKTSETLAARVWFDQAGHLVTKFGITATPAFIKMTAQGIFVTQAPVKTFLSTALRAESGKADRVRKARLNTAQDVREEAR